LSSPSRGTNTACLSPLIVFKRQKRIRASWKASSQVKKHGFTETEVAIVSKTEESASHAFQVIVTLFDMEVTVLYEYDPEGQTVNQHYYIEVLKRD
jgi:hypothetical protein